MKHFLLSISLASALVLPISAQARNVLDLKESLTDSAIVYPESFEQNTQRLLEGWYLKNYTTTDDRYARAKDVPATPEELRKRLAELPTVLDMPYNQVVGQYITNYTSRSRAQVAAMLGLGHYYMPIFEQALEAAGLPQELKYVPVIESALDPNAVSSSGAAGLWQFMVTPAKAMGLEVNSVVDERRDPYLSSEKAVQLLKDLHDTYGDWYLALAAYNCGPGNVNKALRRAGGDPKSHDFWSIYKYLPEQTRGYVPKFIAANYVMNYYGKHNISPVLATKPLVTDTVAVNKRLHFNQVSEVLGIPVEELRILNPQFRADIIPATEERPYYLILPSQQVYAYIVSEDNIFAHDAAKYARRETAEPGDAAPSTLLPTAQAQPEPTPVADVQAEQELADVRQSAATARGKKSVTHKVGAGETLPAIAQRYGVSAQDIKEWNGLRRAAVRAGQQLVIYTDAPAVAPAAPVAQAQPKPARKSEPASEPAPAPQRQKKAQQQQPAQATQPATPQTRKGKKAQQQAVAEAQAAKAQKGKKAKKAQTPKDVQYDVREGDSLERIARRQGVSVADLRKANPKLKGDMIHPGEKLTVPSQKKGNQKQTPAPAQTKKKGKKTRR